MLGKDDIHKGLKLLLSEPRMASAASPGAVAVDVAEDETDVLSINQVNQAGFDVVRLALDESGSHERMPPTLRIRHPYRCWPRLLPRQTLMRMG